MSNSVSRMYCSFRGVDFRGEEVNLIRSPDSVNMWKDYKTTESIRTRPSLELKYSFDTSVYGVFFYDVAGERKILVHSGTSMYEVKGEEKTKINGDIVLNEAPSDSFVYNGVFYFKDGKNYLFYDTATSTLKEVVPYVPTTSIGGTSGNGTPHEDVNLLTGRRKNTFRSTQTKETSWGGKVYAGDYYLDTQNIDKIISVTVDGEEIPEKPTINYGKGYSLGSDGLEKGRIYIGCGSETTSDNIVIEFEKNVDGYADRIKKCTLLQVFDNRIFCSGNPDFPNVLWHCSLNDPTYFSDLDYYNEGLDEAEIRGLVAGNNVLWVFREPSQANTNIFYHTPITDAQYGKIYPGNHSSIATGCIGRAINFNDDIVFFSDRGMEGISGEITAEQVIGHRSTLIDSKLLTEANYKDMFLVEWEGYLFVCTGNHLYLADSRAIFTNENHIEYDWFYWEIDSKITCARVYDGKLYIGTENGVYSFDGKDNVKSHWVTPKDKFDAPQMQKTTNKRGCVVEAVGDITLFTKIETDTDFMRVDEYKDVKDYFVSKIKRKKFKDIQLKFSSETRFSLETATLSAFIGGYVKR